MTIYIYASMCSHIALYILYNTITMLSYTPDL